MNTIVYVAIALLVLVLIVAFTTGGLGKLFSGIAATGPEEIDSIKARCTSLCNTVKTSVTSSGASSWQTGQYCTKEFSVDLDGDNSIGAGEIINCWDSPIDVYCSVQVSGAGGEILFAEQTAQSDDCQPLE